MSESFLEIKLLVSETPALVFPCEFREISKNTFFTEHLQTNASEGVITVERKNVANLRKVKRLYIIKLPIASLFDKFFLI